MDFTLKTYRSLLSALEQSGYAFRTFEEFLSARGFKQRTDLRQSRSIEA